MKFLKEPQTRADEDGEQVLYITNEVGDIYHLKTYEAWKELHIAQEPSGYYSIINACGYGSEFIYKEIQFADGCLTAYYKNEMDNRRYYHIYNGKGDIVRQGIG